MAINLTAASRGGIGAGNLRFGTFHHAVQTGQASSVVRPLARPLIHDRLVRNVKVLQCDIVQRYTNVIRQPSSPRGSNMTACEVFAAFVANYELEFSIQATRERVWYAIVEETNSWWLPDFHVLGGESEVHLAAHAGGGLIEQVQDGGSLLWATVSMCLPGQFAMYLVLHTAPDWGGPTTSNLKLALEDTGEQSCVLKVTDGLIGHVDDENMQRIQHGWERLFTDGLKKYVETGAI